MKGEDIQFFKISSSQIHHLIIKKLKKNQLLLFLIYPAHKIYVRGLLDFWFCYN